MGTTNINTDLTHGPVPCSGPICYCKGYKYQLQSIFWLDTPITGLTAAIPNFISLLPSGRLTIYAGYAWDGASDALDTRDFMRGSLAHDALYQLMREGLINPATHRPQADKLLYALCREDGMSWWRAAYVLWAVGRFASRAATRRDRVRYYAGRETVA